jgi:glycosyltransferase involved in cell wall biosynthesis
MNDIASGPPSPSTPTPTLTIGLPVYNGEEYLSQSLDALLAQTYRDFELIISDNASTDRTADICREYAARDPRIRYIRQPANIGAAPNHNVLVPVARGRYFKWASHDDLYAPELLRRCVEVLEARPDAVLVHAWDAIIDEQGRVVQTLPYTLRTDDPRPWLRLRSLLYEPGGNDFYGVIRTEVLRRVDPHATYYNADRTFVTSLCLQGPFLQVPEVLYFRRDHAGRATRAADRRARAAVLDPARSNRLRYPMALMYVEYVLGFVRGIRQAHLGLVESGRCLAEVAGWFVSCLSPWRTRRSLESENPLEPAAEHAPDAVRGEAS